LSRPFQAYAGGTGPALGRFAVSRSGVLPALISRRVSHLGRFANAGAATLFLGRPTVTRGTRRAPESMRGNGCLRTHDSTWGPRPSPPSALKFPRDGQRNPNNTSTKASPSLTISNEKQANGGLGVLSQPFNSAGGDGVWPCNSSGRRWDQLACMPPMRAASESWCGHPDGAHWRMGCLVL